jgi:eukaryotic-like serine/threonine-protein kinase
MVPSQVRMAKGTVLDRRFVVESVLGQGAMGIVIAARHQTLRKTVVIKMMRPEYSGTPELAQRFLREARAAARLRSEHVIRVTDVDVFASGVPYFIMEYSPGIDLAKHLELHGPLPVPQVIELLLQTLEALAEAHRAGIVHRDLKPANLLLTTREDDSPSIKVLDFGISKCAEASVGGKLTALGSMLGSPMYMAPEQIRDASAVDARADIWSIGVVGYELLTGKQPFTGRTLQAVIATICSEEPEPLPDSVPPLLAEVLGKCLAKRADDRFPTVAELARALAPLSDDLGPRLSIERILRRRSSAPPPPPEMPWLPSNEREKSSRPRRPPSAAARFRAGLLALVAFGAAVSLWLFWRGESPESGSRHAANRLQPAAVSPLRAAVAPPVERTAPEPPAPLPAALPLPLPPSEPGEERRGVRQ